MWHDWFSLPALTEYAEEATLPSKTIIDSWESINSVRLPQGWCDVEALRIWREQDWNALFCELPDVRGDLRNLPAEATVFVTFPGRLAYEMEDELRRIWDANLPKDLPPVDDWGTVHDAEWTGIQEEEFEYSSPEIRVTFPEEVLETHRDELRKIWYLFRYNEYGFIRRLTENSADRSCQYCSGDAEYYVSTEGLVSAFVCSRHREHPTR